MGRPKGLRKGPDGKWYMPSQDTNPEPAFVEQVKQAIKEKPARTEKFRRNDFVAVQESTQVQRGFMLGYVGSKAVVQLLDGVTRLTVDDSRIIPAQEAKN